jgi:hypothetical protein
MPVLISAELFRLRSVRSPRYVVLGLLFGVAVVTALNIDPANGGSGTPAELADSLRSLALIGGVLFAGALAAFNVASEFKFGWAALTYLRDPNRARVSAARALTYAGAGFVLAGLAACVVVAVGLPLGGGGIPASDVARIVAGAAFGGAVLGAVGVLLGVASRNPTIASSAVFGWYQVESLVLPTDVRPYMPMGLVDSLMSGAGDLPAPAAVGLLFAYLAIIALFVRTWALERDLT